MTVSSSSEQAKKARSRITKKVRFEVFKRDSFKCQYCGASSPDVVLHVDHIKPVYEGGGSDMLNLITACQPCNSGKGKRKLTDNSSIKKQMTQLQELNAKREQLEMMIDWRKGLEALSDQTANFIKSAIERKMNGFSINENGLSHISKWNRQFTFEEILSAIDRAADKKLCNGIDSKSAQEFFDLIPKLAATAKMPEHQQKQLYVRGILKNRVYVNDRQVMPIIKSWHDNGFSMDSLVEFAKTVKSWTAFKIYVEQHIEAKNHG